MTDMENAAPQEDENGRDNSPPRRPEPRDFNLDAFFAKGPYRREEASPDPHEQIGNWFDEDPKAIVGLPEFRHPVNRAAMRSKEGRVRAEFRNALRRALARLSDRQNDEVSHDDVMAYPWHHLTPEMLRTYRATIEAMTRVQSTRNDAMSVIRRVLEQCFKVGLISAHRLDELREELQTRTPSRSAKGRVIILEELTLLMTACETTGSPRSQARNSAIVAVMRGTGARVGEVVAANYSDWNRAQQTLLLRNTKNGTDHTVHLSDAVTRYLSRWARFRGAHPGPLFTSLTDGNRADDGPLTTQSVRDMLKRRAKTAGIERPFSPHDFRRTFATELLRTQDMALVSRLLNHNKITSTLVYDFAGDDLMRAAVASLTFPDLASSQSQHSDAQRDVK